jgi:hypothetical protein
MYTTPSRNVLQSKSTICFGIHAWPVTYFSFFMCDIQHCSICRPSDSTASEDVGIEPRAVATTALTVRRSNHSSRSHSRLDHIHNLSLICRLFLSLIGVSYIGTFIPGTFLNVARLLLSDIFILIML